jgi:hypothetical protein
MALNFPFNPTIGATYTSGSSATYEWNGDFWKVVAPSDITVVSAVTSSFSVSGSHSTTALTAVSSSHALRANTAVSASYIAPVYGRTVMTSGTTVSVLATQTGTVMEFTIPSAGVWEVNYNVRTRTTAGQTYASIFLTNTSNTIISGTSTLLTMYYAGTSGQKQATNGAGTPLDVYVNNVPLGLNDFQLNTRGMDFITTTGATTFRIRMTSFIGTTQALSDANGHTAVWYKKLA